MYYTKWSNACGHLTITHAYLQQSTKHMNSFACCSIEITPSLELSCLNPNMFQYDNALVHKATSIKSWFVNDVVEALTWPVQNSDPNPTEQIWVELENCVTGILTTAFAFPVGEIICLANLMRLLKTESLC